jgi:hypothetical protein
MICLPPMRGNDVARMGQPAGSIAGHGFQSALRDEGFVVGWVPRVSFAVANFAQG